MDKALENENIMVALSLVPEVVVNIVILNEITYFFSTELLYTSDSKYILLKVPYIYLKPFLGMKNFTTARALFNHHQN